MRIAQFLIGNCSLNASSGVTRTVYYLSKTLGEMGQDVKVFQLTRETASPIPSASIQSIAPNKYKFILPEALKEELLKWKPDVVHLHSSYNLETALLANWLRKQGIAYVQTPHGNLSREQLKRRWYLKIPYTMLIQRPYLNRAAFIHSVGDHDDISDYGITRPIIYAPNCIDLTELPEQVDRDYIYEKFPQTRDKRIFLFLGRLDLYQKGLDFTLEGFIKANLKHSVLILIGPDSYKHKAQIQQIIADAQQAENILVLDPVYGDEKFKLLSSADVFVHTSRWEGAAFSILEAAAMGTPLFISIGADKIGLLDKYDIGIRINELTVDKVADGFQRFESMPEDALDRLGQEARKTIEENFNWANSAQILLDAYKQYAI